MTALKQQPERVLSARNSHSTSVSEAVIAVAATTIVLATVKMHPSLKVTGKALLAAAIMGIVVSFTPEIHVLLKILIGIVVYAILLIALRAVTKDELKKLTNRAA